MRNRVIFSVVPRSAETATGLLAVEPALLGAVAAGAAGGPPGAGRVSGIQRSGGHSRTSTRPLTAETGTGPKIRESIDPLRESPSTKMFPAGTVTGPK